jgi:hypothetical protein
MMSFLSMQIFRNSGLTKPLREIFLPESPCYEPILDHSCAKPDSIAVLPVSCSLDPAKRADQAAEVCPSWSGAKATAVSFPSDKRLRSRPRIRDFYNAYSSGRFGSCCVPVPIRGRIGGCC